MKYEHVPYLLTRTVLLSFDNHNTMATNKKSRRGFAAMDPAKQRAIARMGGKASHGGGRKKKNIVEQLTVK